MNIKLLFISLIYSYCNVLCKHITLVTFRAYINNIFRKKHKFTRRQSFEPSENLLQSNKWKETSIITTFLTVFMVRKFLNCWPHVPHCKTNTSALAMLNRITTAETAPGGGFKFPGNYFQFKANI